MHRRLTLALIVAAGVTGWARRGGLRHVVVRGRSMHPTLEPGDRLVLVRAPGRPRTGWLALAPDPRSPDRTLLKRVHRVAGERVDLRGDHPAASTDSRAFGPVPMTPVRCYIAWRYAPHGRIGRVARPTADRADGRVA